MAALVWRWLGAVVSALVVAVPTGPHPTDATYLQFNMCGNLCNHGALDVVRNLEDTVSAERPAAVTLNEVCENQYDQLRLDLPGFGGRFDPTGPHCDNGTRYGNAVLTRGSAADLVGSWPLPNPGGDEGRRLMCVRGRALVVCVTHVSFVAANIAVQVDAVAGILRGLPAGAPVLLGGDFNADPADARMDPLYRTGSGALTEAGSRSRSSTDADATFGRRKIDYIFLGHGGRRPGVRAAAVDAGRGRSDHRALLASSGG